ncbi:hypothetical protein LTR78_003084 [Recurvomyces mirabilis]|uniref:Protein kinase domain-containing protein n=1 Tax=Recurvomyces mirabilis TaxID=574656 RepID=A0AAE1C3L1_9PEZI|nr:hypothetical protein LTR78_003084 [Recurvomyces mirabilis]KAK5157094.1 hypothetical protein LTS14_004612 [Recurvomyces mirabilis]
MEMYRPAHAHARRSHLTKLYDDTKKSALTSINVYNRTIELFPDLQRKFRIQKDRLMTWGLTWSDDEREGDVNIDDAVARAGLTETVDSVLRNIKEVTEEAERLANAPRGLGLGGEKAPVPSNEPFDRTRYEDLIRDLTTSIDILYELSRSRKALARGEHPVFEPSAARQDIREKAPSIHKSLARKPSFASSELTLVNPPPFHRPSLSPYAGLPPSIEISALRLPEEGPPPYDSLGVPVTTRQSARLIRRRASASVQDRLGSGAEEVAVLVEYAEFDSVYRDTHVPPPLQRLEALAGYLQPMRADSQTNLSLLGYFEDPRQPRIGLVYDVPYAIQNRLQATIEHAEQSWTPTSLRKLVQKSTKAQAPAGEQAVPALEDRFRLALRLTEQLHELHSCAIAHGNINSSSILFTVASQERPARQLRSPLWASFDLFSKCNLEGSGQASNLNVYRHPDDVPHQTGRSLGDDFKYDFYSLALVLLEVGLWTSVGEVYKPRYTLADFKLRLEKIWIPKLAQKCGTVYMRAVEACFRMADSTEASGLTVDGNYEPILARLRKCCLLDDIEGPTEPPSRTASITTTASSSYSNKISRKPVAGSFIASPISRQQSEPQELLHTQSYSSSPVTAPHRLASLPNLSAATAPAQYGRLGAPTTPQLRRQPSTRSNASARSGMSQMRQQITDQFTSTPSFKEYKRRVTFIQQRWRERMVLCQEQHAARRARSNNPYSLNATIRDVVEPELTRAVRPMRRTFSNLSVPKEVVQYWEQDAAPRLAKLCDKALKGSKESASICVAMYGETLETAKPTFLITCKSTAKMKQTLQKYFKHDSNLCCVRVKKTGPGDEITYSRRARVHGDSAARRSMALAGQHDKAMNPDYQERPLCGASIGAYRDDEHLPPVSFGGVILLDDTAYGMSVHHMLEHPDNAEEEDDEDAEAGADDESDTSSLGSCSDAISISSNSDDDDTVRPASTISDAGTTIQVHSGDLPGIHPETDYEDIDVTQPALDDAIDCDLHADASDEELDEDDGIDEDHLDSYKLGQVFASSGLKRSATSTQDGFKSISQSLPQEIDWALFELVPPRVHPFNIIKGGSKYDGSSNSRGDSYPVDIRESSQLACAKVHCLGRTSGLASGVISSTMELVKIHGRSTFSASWTVDGGFGAGGDSGAWVISNDDGRVCGHVLASKTGRTYICPMELLLEDIRRTLKVESVSLPNMAAAEVGRASTRRADKVMAAAIENMRIAESDLGGVPLPASPPRSQYLTMLRKARS